MSPRNCSPLDCHTGIAPCSRQLPRLAMHQHDKPGLRVRSRTATLTLTISSRTACRTAQGSLELRSRGHHRDGSLPATSSGPGVESAASQTTADHHSSWEEASCEGTWWWWWCAGWGGGWGDGGGRECLRTRARVYVCVCVCTHDRHWGYEWGSRRRATAAHGALARASAAAGKQLCAGACRARGARGCRASCGCRGAVPCAAAQRHKRHRLRALPASWQPHLRILCARPKHPLHLAKLVGRYLDCAAAWAHQVRIGHVGACSGGRGNKQGPIHVAEEVRRG